MDVRALPGRSISLLTGPLESRGLTGLIHNLARLPTATSPFQMTTIVRNSKSFSPRLPQSSLAQPCAIFPSSHPPTILSVPRSSLVNPSAVALQFSQSSTRSLSLRGLDTLPFSPPPARPPTMVVQAVKTASTSRVSPICQNHNHNHNHNLPLSRLFF